MTIRLISRFRNFFRSLFEMETVTESGSDSTELYCRSFDITDNTETEVVWSVYPYPEDKIMEIPKEKYKGAYPNSSEPLLQQDLKRKFPKRQRIFNNQKSFVRGSRRSDN